MAELFSAVTASRPMKTLYKAVIVVSGVSCFLYTFHVLYRFMCFASSHNDSHRYISATGTTGKTRRAFHNPFRGAPYEVLHDDNLLLSTLWSLLIDTCLLSLFMLQHSFMATDLVKDVYRKLNLQGIERSIYNAASAGALHFLMNTWQPAPAFSLWEVNTTESNNLWLTFTAFHALGWFIVYSGCLMMDISELVGLKQVYYKLSARPCPLSTKSRELQRYYAHMRHPSFSGFLMILWIHPFMTIDRFIFSSLLTVYMVTMWTIDQDDYRYHANTINTKRRHLS